MLFNRSALPPRQGLGAPPPVAMAAINQPGEGEGGGLSKVEVALQDFW